MMLKQLLIPGSLALLLAACQSGAELQMDDEFGNSVRQNIAVQTLNPDAGGPDGSATLDGQRVQNAVDDLRTRDVGADTGSLTQDIGGN
jgi:type IV pilus biogenesis protein CpaD/CtpE